MTIFKLGLSGPAQETVNVTTQKGELVSILLTDSDVDQVSFDRDAAIQLLEVLKYYLEA